MGSKKTEKEMSNEKEKREENGAIDSCHGDNHTLC